MRLFALTGSIGSGKSTVTDILLELGAIVIDADLLAREAVRVGSPALLSIIQHVGDGILSASGELNRKALAEIVFNDTAKRLRLEDIVHPEVHKLFRQKMAQISSDASLSNKAIFYSIPLLFESKLSYPTFEKIILVSAPREDCISRICARDNCSREAAARRLDAQLPLEQKIPRADIVIDNTGTLKALRERVVDVYRDLLKSQLTPA